MTSTASLNEILTFLESNRKSKECCPISWKSKFTALSSLPLKDIAAVDEKIFANLVELSHRSWPYGDTNRNADNTLDILDFYGKISSNESGDRTYTCFRVMIFELLVGWSGCDKVVSMLGKLKYFDKFPAWLKQLMPNVDFAKPNKFIQDPEFQVIAEITFCIMKLAVNAMSNKSIGKHVFFLCASTMGSLYKPDVATDRSIEHMNDRFAEVFGTFYNEGLHFAHEDLALKLMSNGTSAKLRELTMHGQRQACLATVHFDYKFMDAYAKTQGNDELNQMAASEKQGMTLKEEANNLYKNNEVSKAYDCYKKSIEIWPYDAKTWGNLALCCQKLNRAKEGKEAAFACLQKDPKWWKSWCRVGDVLNKKKTSRLAYLAYTVADHLQKSNEISERLAEFNREKAIDIDTEFNIKDPLEFFLNETQEKCALFIGYQVLKSDTKKIKTLEENVGETISISAASFGSKSSQFGISDWVFNVYSHKEKKPISVSNCISKPNGSDLKNAFLRAVCFPMNGKACIPTVLLVAHRFAAHFSYLVDAVTPYKIFVRLETKKEAEFASIKFNTNPNGDNSQAGEADIKTLQNVYHQSTEE